MTVIDVNVGDAIEPTSVPASEYQVRCMGAEVSTSQKGEDYLNLRLEIMDHLEAKDVYHVAMLPVADGDAKATNRRKLGLKRVCEAFGVDYSSGINPDEFLGGMAWAILTEEEDEEYGKRNRVRRFVTGA